MTLRENISNEIASPQQAYDASFTGTTGSNNLQNLVKGAKFIDSGISGWDLTEQDLVLYKDQMRRGLQFLFSMAQKTNMIGDKSTFKIVSVYQKGVNNEDGDFVVVSRYMNDPHNVRVVDVTNDWYGDPDPEPMEIISKVVEMADGTGMIRNINEYGDYGKTESMIETADTMDNFRETMLNVGIESLTAKKESISPVSNVINNFQGTKEGEKVFNAVSSATQAVQPPSAMSRIGRGVFGAISSLFKSGVSALAKGTTATKATTVSPIAVGAGAVAGAQKGVLQQEKDYQKQLKTQKTEQYQDEKLNLKNKEIESKEKLGILGLGTKLTTEGFKDKTKKQELRYKYNIGARVGKSKRAAQDAFDKDPDDPPNGAGGSGLDAAFAQDIPKGQSKSIKEQPIINFQSTGGSSFAAKFEVPGKDEPFFKTPLAKTAPKKQKVTTPVTPKADKRAMGTTQYSQPYTTKMY
jgi:hypothetical protein